VGLRTAGKVETIEIQINVKMQQEQNMKTDLEVETKKALTVKHCNQSVFEICTVHWYSDGQRCCLTSGAS